MNVVGGVITVMITRGIIIIVIRATVLLATEEAAAWGWPRPGQHLDLQSPQPHGP